MVKYIYFFIFFFTCSSLYANEEDYKIKYSAFEGKHFYAGFMQNEFRHEHEYTRLNQINISTRDTANITVTVPGHGVYNYHINKDSILEIVIPNDLEVITSEVVRDSLVEITSDNKIVAYAYNSQRFSSDSYTLIPVSNWGYQYKIVSMPNDKYDHPENAADSIFMHTIRPSEFMVMAAHDSTVLKFQPEAITEKKRQKIDTTTVVLNKGQCYLVKSYPTQKYTGDLSGSKVWANKPIGVLSGHVRTAVPQNDPSIESKDHLCEQLLPYRAWGRIYISIPFGFTDGGDMIKIFPKEDNTTVDYLNNEGFGQINFVTEDEFATISSIKSPTIWKANHAIQLAQFMKHKDTRDPDFDPSYVVLQPIEQSVQRLLFSTLGNSLVPTQYLRHYVILICDSAAVDNVRIDHTRIDSLGKEQGGMVLSENKIFDTGYYWTRLEVGDGQYQLSCDKGGFTGIIYGSGYADSYSMILGSSLTNPFQEDSTKPVLSYIDTCGRISGTIIDTSANTSGVDFANFIKDGVINMEYDIELSRDSIPSASFTAEVIDLFQDAEFKLNYSDKNGNGSVFTYKFEGYKLEYPDLVDFGLVYSDYSEEIEFEIVNISNRDISIFETNIPSGYTLELEFYDPLPYTLKPGDTLKLKIKISPNEETPDLNDVLVFKIDCDLEIEIPLLADIQAPSLYVENYDFGKILINKDTCAQIPIVNDGVVDLLISSVEFLENTRFELDTAGVFPVTLKVGDTLWLKVCFNPDQLINFSGEIYIHNDLVTDKSFHVYGTGAASDIPSIVIDWGRRRVGTQNDTIAKLYNNGNYYELLKFLNYTINETYNPDINRDIIESINNAFIDYEDSLEYDFKYIPQDTNDYHLKAILETNWDEHPELSIELLGKGTIPVINTYDVDLGLVYVEKSLDTLAKVISSTGNEDLSIKSIKIKSGDKDVIQLNTDLTDFDNSILPYGVLDSIINMNIHFDPVVPGNYELILSVEHDAMPDYEYTESEFRIFGYSLVGDTLIAEIEAEDQVLNSCQNEIYNFEISNSGNKNLILKELNYVIDNPEIQGYWVDEPIIGSVIKINSSEDYSLNLLSPKGQTAKLRFEAILYKEDDIETEITISKEVNLSNHKEMISIDDLAYTDLVIGDTVVMTFSGVFPYTNEISFIPELELEIERKSFELLSKSTFLKIKDDFSTNKKLKINLSQEYERVLFDIEDNSLLLENSLYWSFDLKFLTLLNNKKEPSAKLIVKDSVCFQDIEKNIDISLADICNFNLRQVYSTLDAEMLIYPNPSSDKLNLLLFMPAKGDINIELIDLMGNKYPIVYNFHLEKGKHSLIFDISTMSNGIYNLKAYSKTMLKNKLFIKSK